MRGARCTERWTSMDGIFENIQQLAQGGGIKPIIVAIALVVATAIVSHIATKVIHRIMQVDGSPVPESSILVNIARIAIWVIGISIMLSACFNVDVNGLVAAIGVGGVALSLGMQDTIKNFIGGLQVTLMGIVHPGDHVIVDGIEGIVQDVSWRQTVVKDYENVVHLIPNSIINAATVAKIKPENLVTTVVVLNTDGRDIDEVLREMEQLAKHAVEKVAPLKKDPWLLVTQIGEYGIWAKMRFVLHDVSCAREARDAAMRAIAPYTRNNADTILLDSGADD